jgi:hypothetical protein
MEVGFVSRSSFGDVVHNVRIQQYKEFSKIRISSVLESFDDDILEEIISTFVPAASGY